SGYDNHARDTSVGDRVFGNDLHSTAGVDRLGCLGDSVKAERRFLPTGNIYVLENFPRAAEIDNHCALRNEEGDWNWIFVRRLDRTWSIRRFILFRLFR